MAEKARVTKGFGLWSGLFSLALLFRALWEVFSPNRLTVICDSHKKSSHGKIASVTPVPASHCSWNVRCSALIPLALRLWLSHIGCFISRSRSTQTWNAGTTLPPSAGSELTQPMRLILAPDRRNTTGLDSAPSQSSCKEPPRSQPLNQTVSKWAVCLMYTNVPDRSQRGSILPTERLKLRKDSLLLLRSCTQGMLEPPCERWEPLSFKPCLTLPLGPVCLFSEELPNTTDFFQNACLCC